MVKTFSDLVSRAREMAAFSASPVMQEATRRQAAVEERAIRLKHKHALADDVAVRVSLFSFGGWAQRYPVRADDLGEAAADFYAEWTLRHHESDTDALYRALAEWQGGLFMTRLRAAIAGV